LDRAVIAEREDSVPVSVFLDSQLLANGTLSEGLSTVNLRSSPGIAGNNIPKGRCVPLAQAQICERLNMSSAPPCQNYGPGTLLPGARSFHGSGTVQLPPTRQSRREGE